MLPPRAGVEIRLNTDRFLSHLGRLDFRTTSIFVRGVVNFENAKNGVFKIDYKTHAQNVTFSVTAMKMHV